MRGLLLAVTAAVWTITPEGDAKQRMAEAKPILVFYHIPGDGDEAHPMSPFAFRDKDQERERDRERRVSPA